MTNPNPYPFGEPSPKSEGLETLIGALMGKDRRATIATGGCMTCDRGPACAVCREYREHPAHTDAPISHAFSPYFRDELSAKEYTIGGMCQSCQDSVFGTEEL